MSSFTDIPIDERFAAILMPGRIELAGNHVDHQGGRALTATVDRYIEVRAMPNGTCTIAVESEGFPEARVDVTDTAPREEERFTSAALVRGVAAALQAQGIYVSGFDAQVRGFIPVGRGLSSSAAYELAIASAITQLFCDEQPDTEVLVQAALTAEREYFGKPCGAMDQRAIAYGGIVAHDFSREAEAEGRAVRPLNVDFAALGYEVCLVDTHCDHSLYPDEFSQVVCDMNAVAAYFGADRLGELDEAHFRAHLADVQRALGDQPALRAMHFFHEVRLVDARVAALEAGDMEAFLTATRLSGASSAAFLQNVSTTDRRTQPAMIALAVVQSALGTRGACRIHGGGFGGTIQAFVPVDLVDDFVREVDSQLGEGSCLRLRIVR